MIFFLILPKPDSINEAPFNRSQFTEKEKKGKLQMYLLKYVLCSTAVAIYWASLEFPRPPREKLMWTGRFEGGASPFVFLLIMILRRSKIKEDPGG